MRKLSVSNLAWASSDDEQVFEKLNELNISGVEIAPTKVFGVWEDIDLNKVTKYRSYLSQRHLQASSLQAILFQKEVNIFDESHHDVIIKHFELLSEIAYHLHAENMVFGAPRTRKRNSISYSEATGLALKLFDRLASIASAKGSRIVLEANPIEYGCDFLTCHSDVISFVSNLDNEGMGFHIDTGALKMTSDLGIKEHFDKKPKHCHISVPKLSPITTEPQFVKQCLRAIPDSYENWIVLEMLEPSSLEELFNNLVLFSEG